MTSEVIDTVDTPPAAAGGTVGSDRWYLSAASIPRALAHMCVPMAAGLSVGAVYNIINGAFIGSLHDPALLAAITFGLPLIGLIMAVGGVFGVGVFGVGLAIWLASRNAIDRDLADGSAERRASTRGSRGLTRSP